MRYFLVKSSIAIVSAYLFTATVLYASDRGHEEPHWGYDGIAGPEKWGSLKSGHERCQDGERQSPIDIKISEATEGKTLESIFVHYTNAPLEIVNNGHTIQVNGDGHSTAVIGGKEFTLVQLHFHEGSEHTVDGKQYPMEVHLVHQSEVGELAVIGVFMDIGDPNEVVKTVFDNMPAQAGEKKVDDGIKINATGLLPDRRGFYHYLGSLTTPPCTQIVEWYVMKEPITISEAQHAQFQKLYKNTFRPTQELGARKLLHK